MIECNLLKFLFIWNFHNEIVCRTLSIFFSDIAKYDCLIKTRETFGFLSLTNNPDATEIRFLILSISAIISSKTKFCGFFQYFYKFYLYHLKNLIKGLKSMKCFKSLFAYFLITN